MNINQREELKSVFFSQIFRGLFRKFIVSTAEGCGTLIIKFNKIFCCAFLNVDQTWDFRHKEIYSKNRTIFISILPRHVPLPNEHLRVRAELRDIKVNMCILRCYVVPSDLCHLPAVAILIFSCSRMNRDVSPVRGDRLWGMKAALLIEWTKWPK